MFFEDAGISVHPIWPPLVAFAISFFTSMGGVSGAFLLLPFQMSVLGYTAPSVSATNQLFNVVAIPSGVYRYIKEGRMVWPLAGVVVAGTLPGVFFGAVIRVRYLPDPMHFKLFAAVVLFYIGLRMMRDLTRRTTATGELAGQEGRLSPRRHQQIIKEREGAFTTKVVAFTFTRLEYEFCDRRYCVSLVNVSILCLLVGVIGGIYGIGGGAIIAPFLVSFFRLPVHTVAGAALLGTFATSVAGVVFYQSLAPFYPDLLVAPDWTLGILFGLGGAVGIYSGARCQKHVPSKWIKWMLALIIVATAGNYVFAFLSAMVPS